MPESKTGSAGQQSSGTQHNPRSMTGFARQEAKHAWGTLTWEIRSVNHRYLEPHFRLPETLRTLGLWLGRLRRSFTTVKTELEKEIGMDEIRRQLHNEAVMAEMKRIETEVAATKTEASDAFNSIDPNPAGTAPSTPADRTATDDTEQRAEQQKPADEAPPPT